MLELNDTRWNGLRGAYGEPYDPRSALAKLHSGTDVEAAWDELWEQLHHQGKVGEASYASVPHLVRIHRERDKPDWNTYALVGLIEIERHEKSNPPLPDWLEDGFQRGLEELAELGLQDLVRTEDEHAVRSILGVIALARGLHMVGDLMISYTDNELREMTHQYNEPDNQS